MGNGEQPAVNDVEIKDVRTVNRTWTSAGTFHGCLMEKIGNAFHHELNAWKMIW